jgi:hypothetical protein
MGLQPEARKRPRLVAEDYQVRLSRASSLRIKANRDYSSYRFQAQRGTAAAATNRGELFYSVSKLTNKLDANGPAPTRVELSKNAIEGIKKMLDSRSPLGL